VTRLVFRKELGAAGSADGAGSTAHRRLAREVLSQMFSVPVLFGEALIVCAERGAAD
jgi:hypothetical protein